eukprot:scpid23491/ scgid6924/ 
MDSNRPTDRLNASNYVTSLTATHAHTASSAPCGEVAKQELLLLEGMLLSQSGQASTQQTGQGVPLTTTTGEARKVLSQGRSLQHVKRLTAVEHGGRDVMAGTVVVVARSEDLKKYRERGKMQLDLKAAQRRQEHAGTGPSQQQRQQHSAVGSWHTSAASNVSQQQTTTTTTATTTRTRAAAHHILKIESVAVMHGGAWFSSKARCGRWV